MTTEAVVYDAVRTPFGKYGGALGIDFGTLSALLEILLTDQTQKAVP